MVEEPAPVYEANQFGTNSSVGIEDDVGRRRCQLTFVHPSSGKERNVEMAKERRAPPYMRWDQRGRPVLQATLKLPDGTTVRAMLNTDDRKIAVRRMRLIVVLLVRDGRLPADSGAAQLYGRRPARGVAEVKRLAALSREEYAVKRKPAAARLGLSPPTLDYLTKQQLPELPNRERQRRHRAREQGQRIAMANFWYHRPPRGKGFYKNGRVMTARIQLARSATTWSLKFRDDDRASRGNYEPRSCGLGSCV